MSKMVITETPIKCPRCLDKVNPDCKGCEGTGLVTETETVKDDGYTYTPMCPSVWPVDSIKPWVEPSVTWTYAGTTLITKTCDHCGGTGKVEGSVLYSGYLLTNGPASANVSACPVKINCFHCGGTGSLIELR